MNYERKIELAKENISRKGKNRASRFNEAHRLTVLKEGDRVLVEAMNESTLKRKSSRNFCKFMGAHTK